MKRELYHFIPDFAKPVARRSYYFVSATPWMILDALDLLRNKRSELVPPRWMRVAYHIGLADFEKSGNEYLRYAVSECGLKPDGAVLDVGCGLGRFAVPLTKYLSDIGSYCGLDLDPRMVAWCKESISTRFPGFEFLSVDVHNALYNPRGKIRPSQLKFPFPDEAFDFALLYSVFTHMLPDDVDNYLAEISRVLKVGGSCLVSFVLINSESLELMNRGVLPRYFPHPQEPYYTLYADMPETSIAYEEEYVRKLYERNHLKVLKVDYGSWRGRENPRALARDKDIFLRQDLVVASKRTATQLAQPFQFSSSSPDSFG